MTAPRRATAQAGGHRAALLLAVALVVLGIVGMHALSDHGTTRVTAADHAATTSQHTDGSGPTHSHHAAGAAAPEEEGGSAHGLTLCLALLVGLGATLLVRSRPLGTRWRLSPRSWWRSAPAPRPSRRATGPPPVWEFSVIRC